MGGVRGCEHRVCVEKLVAFCYSSTSVHEGGRPRLAPYLMPLTASDLEEIRAENFADDVEIDFPRMAAWTREEAGAFFESGGVMPTPPAGGGQLLSSVPTDMKVTGAGEQRFSTENAPPAVFVASDGCRIVYQFSPGPRTPIVYAGGGGSGRLAACSEFGAESARTKEHAMLIFDRRGAADGASDVLYDGIDDAGGISEVEVQARDVVELIIALKLPPVILYGWSSGARLFGVVALSRPELVRAVVLQILTGGPTAASYLGDAYYLQYANAAKRGGMEDVLATPAMRAKVAINERVAPYLSSLSPERFIRAMRASAALFSRTKDEPALGLRASDLQNLRVPALVVHSLGEPSDGMHTKAVTRAVADVLPEAEPPVVSEELGVWYGAVLKFLSMHGGQLVRS